MKEASQFGARRVLGDALPLTLAWLGASGIATLALALGNAHFFAPDGTIDSWFYTSGFANLHEAIHSFGYTYYASRLPWIVPGHIAFVLFGPFAGYFVLHAVFFFGSALLLGLLVKDYLGLAPAAVAMTAMMSTPVYFVAHRWDYVDGTEIAYLLATMYFALAPRPGRRAWLYPGLAGFFAMAVLVTQFYSFFFLLGLPLLGAALLVRRPISALVSRLQREAKAWAVGAVLLLVGYGIVAVAYGGNFFFFMPQVRELTAVSPGQYKDLSYAWSREPRILATPLAILLSVMLLLRRRSVAGAGDERALRFGLGVTLFSTFVYGVLAAWEFLSAGTPFELPDRFSVTVICGSLSLAVVVYLLGQRGRIGVTATVAAMVAAALPVYLVYGFRKTAMTGTLFMTITLAAGAALAIGVLLVRLTWLGRLRTAVAVAVLVGVAFTMNLALSASHEPHKWYSLPDGRPTYAIALDLMHLLDQQHVDTTKRIFWFDASTPGHQWIQSVQSIYYYDWTAVGHHMPRVDAELRQRLAFYKPKQVVLLCATARCGGATEALRARGYTFRERQTRELRSERRRLWVRILDMAEA